MLLTPRPSSDRAPGTYALVLEAAGRTQLAMGRRGRVELLPGCYVYAGSALGAGGLRARIRRHLDPTRPVHWHIDHLKRVAHVVEVWYLADPIRREHAWAKALANLSNASIPMPGFGSSDCACPAHLFHFSTRPRLATFARALRQAGGGSGQSIRRLPIASAG